MFGFRALLGIGVITLAGFACGSSTTANGNSAPPAGVDGGDSIEAGEVADAAEAGTTSPLITQRPYLLQVPKGYDAAKGAPLLVSLHGYGSDALEEESYLGFKALAESKTFLYAYPQGTPNELGKNFWNATDACCGFGSEVDDVAYITAVIDDVSARYKVDPSKIWLFGHSNGGFMAHRLGCELSTRLAAVVSLAGAVWKDETKCAPTARISVVQIHGDMDKTIYYEGGSAAGLGGPTHPSATQTVATWAKKNGCTGALGLTGRADLVSDLAADETRVEAYAGCPTGVGVELWTLEGGSHIPSFGPGFRDRLFTFLDAHPKIAP